MAKDYFILSLSIPWMIRLLGRVVAVNVGFESLLDGNSVSRKNHAC